MMKHLTEVYDPMVYATLPDFWDVRDAADGCEEEIRRVGKVIQSYGLTTVIGLGLLHRHFQIGEGEIVLQRFVDGHSAAASVEPIDRAGDALPYLWKLDPGETAVFRPLEYCAYPPKAKQLAMRHLRSAERADGFLELLADVMLHTRLHERFGIIALLSRSWIEHDSTETLFETSDEENRQLLLRRVKRPEVKAHDTTKTLWMFKPALGATFMSGVDCAGHCGSHCHGHCNSHKRAKD